MHATLILAEETQQHFFEAQRAYDLIVREIEADDAIIQEWKDNTDGGANFDTNLTQSMSQSFDSFGDMLQASVQQTALSRDWEDSDSDNADSSQPTIATI